MTNSNSNDLANIDIKELIEVNSTELSLDPDIYQHMLEIVFTHGQQDIEQLNEAIEQEDVQAIKTLAHRLKGEYSNIRLSSLAEPAAGIHKLSLSEGTLDEIKELFLQLTSAYKQLKEKM